MKFLPISCGHCGKRRISEVSATPGATSRTRCDRCGWRTTAAVDTKGRVQVVAVDKPLQLRDLHREKQTA